MARTSINSRLLVIGTIWSGLALLATGLVLAAMFEDHVVKEFEATLDDQLHEILELIVVTADGHVALQRHPVDPRFNRLGSGWYWQATAKSQMAERSRSLGADTLETVGLLRRPETISFSTRDASGQPLRGIRRQVVVPGSSETLTITVTGPAAIVDQSVRDFTGTTVIFLAILGISLVFGLMLQVNYGLRPLAEIRTTLAAIRAGHSQRLTGDFPREVSPLVDELNALLERDAALVDRARTQAGNLAHALKTPLTVLNNLAQPMTDETGQVLRRQVDLMTDSVEWHVSQARAAGAHKALDVRVAVGPVVGDLCRMFDRVHAERKIEITVTGVDDLDFKGDRRDLEEMLGNLMDNACKWAQRKVEVRAEASRDRLLLAVHDDGDGIAEEHHSEVLNRGRHLDKMVPGSGLGLSIVREVAELHGGTLVLARSALGGLAATLDLPLA
jgi:signal transduction histidine kinase